MGKTLLELILHATATDPAAAAVDQGRTDVGAEGSAVEAFLKNDGERP